MKSIGNIQLAKSKNSNNGQLPPDGYRVANCIFISCLAAALFSQVAAHCQQFSARSILDTNEMLIGDQIHLTISASAPENEVVAWPQVGDTLIEKIEVLGRSPIDTAYNKEEKIFWLSQTFTLTSFDSGYYAIPPFRFFLATDTSQFKETEPLLLTVIPVNADTTQSIKDIKKPLDAPFSIQELWPYLIAAAALITVVLLIIYLYRKFRKKSGLPPLAPKRALPPHIEAIEKLNNLKISKLWQQGKVKLYHTELTEIIRIYVERRFNIIAMELTSYEIIEAIQKMDVSKESQEKLQHFLQLADLVKFAKSIPLPSEHELSMKNAVDFVNETASQLSLKSDRKMKNHHRDTEYTEKHKRKNSVISVPHMFAKIY